MRPLSTVLLCTTLLLVASGTLAEQPPSPLAQPPGVMPGAMPGADPYVQPGANGLSGVSGDEGLFGHRRDDQSITKIEPGCVGTKSRCEAEVDSLFLTLDHGRNQDLVLGQLIGAVRADVNDLPYKFEFGPRITMGYQTSDGPIFEVGYFGIFNYKSFLDLESPLGVLTLPRHFNESTVDFNDANRMQLRLSARINSVEANLRYAQENMPNTAVLVGLRYFRMEERFNLFSFDAVDPVVGTLSGLSQYDVQTRNELFGGQVGTTWERKFSRLGLRGSAKFGVFDDEARQGQFVTDEDSRFVLRNTGARRSRNVFMTDLSFAATYCLRNNVNLIGGYNLIWFDKMARATDQLDFTLNTASGTGVQFLKGALLHGPHFGLEAKW